VSIGALAVGLAQAALDAAVPYARTREQFGRPIGTFQGVAFMIADMATEIEAARQLVWRAAWLKDQGRDYSLAAAQAKLFASEVSSRATNAAIQVHGGYGYVEEYKVERYLRDAKLTEIGEGTSQIQRLVIARRILACASSDGRPATQFPVPAATSRPLPEGGLEPGAQVPGRPRHTGSRPIQTSPGC
jgi:alkylation response protein AidB-like acyl-CoA dehydrogenase